MGLGGAWLSFFPGEQPPTARESRSAVARIPAILTYAFMEDLFNPAHEGVENSPSAALFVFSLVRGPPQRFPLSGGRAQGPEASEFMIFLQHLQGAEGDPGNLCCRINAIECREHGDQISS
jgi:hypothetical protein